jgi:hypothetical protein
VSTPRVNTTDPGPSPQNGIGQGAPVWQNAVMCFSAEADLAAGIVVGAVAIDALRHVRRPAQLPLAAVPAVFSVHHLTEVLVWWSLQGHVSSTVGERAAWFYLLVAFAVLPVLVPLAVRAVEPADGRRALLGVLAVAGAAAAFLLMAATTDGHVGTRIDGHHIVYNAGVAHDTTVTTAYVIATCGAMLLSSHVPIRWYGAGNLVVVSLLAWVQQTALVSLWCLWAASTSVLIAVQLRRDLVQQGQAEPRLTTAGS